MNQNSSPDKIPEIRFPEFEGDWSKKSLGDLCEVGTGNKDTQNRVDEGKYPFYVRSNTVEKINSYSFDGEAILTSGDGVGVGKNFHYVNGKFDYHQRVYCLRHFLPEYNGKLIYHIFSNKFYKRVMKLSAKNSVDSVRMDMITKMPISLPTLPEQQKIAAFLTAHDDYISSLEKEEQLLQDYKKGIMQRIFAPKDDPKRLRFKIENEVGELVEAPEWEEKKLGEVFSFYSTNSLSREKLNYDVHSVYNIHYGDIHTKFKSTFNLEKEYVPFINKDVEISKIKRENYCKTGDVILADASEDYNDIGKAIEIINLNDEKVLSGLHTILARPKIRFATGFNAYYLQNNIVRKQIMKVSQGTKVLGLSTKQLSTIDYHIPSIEEQQKIATFLAKIDEQIDNVKTQIEQAKVYKKGLLQKMFV